MSNRRRRHNPVRELLARLGRPDLLAMPDLDVADVPRPPRPPRLNDLGLPTDRDWQRETRNAIARRPPDSQQ